jgi:hypothetical protein
MPAIELLHIKMSHMFEMSYIAYFDVRNDVNQLRIYLGKA